MENIDIIILTILVVVSFVVFIATSLKEFNKMEEEPYTFEKASGFTRAALFNVLSSFFEDDEIPEKTREKFKSTIKHTISDMESDGIYSDEKFKKPGVKKKPKKRPEEED